MAPSSCRNGKVVVFCGNKGREVPARLTVTVGDLMGQRVWNALAEPLKIPIGTSGGGFGPLRIPVRNSTMQYSDPCPVLAPFCTARCRLL